MSTKRPNLLLHYYDQLKSSLYYMRSSSWQLKRDPEQQTFLSLILLNKKLEKTTWVINSHPMK